MGFLKGLADLATSPVKIAVKSADSILNKDWEIEDVMTLGVTKVIKETADTVKDVAEEFED